MRQARQREPRTGLEDECTTQVDVTAVACRFYPLAGLDERADDQWRLFTDPSELSEFNRHFG